MENYIPFSGLERELGNPFHILLSGLEFIGNSSEDMAQLAITFARLPRLDLAERVISHASNYVGSERINSARRGLIRVQSYLCNT